MRSQTQRISVQGAGPVTGADRLDIPLCVDLDHTLVRTDTLHESVLLLAKKRPQMLAHAILSMLRGRARFKESVAASMSLDPTLLPYNESTLALIRAERAEGRKIVLVTAAHRSIADAVAKHLELFDEVFATDAGLNLKGSAKRAFLVDRFGEGGFDYIGDHRSDLPIFRSARESILVDRSGGAHAALGKHIEFSKVLSAHGPTSALARLKPYVAMARIDHWFKNIFILPGIVLAFFFYPEHLAITSFWKVALGIFATCLIASSYYVLNEILDGPTDRHHPLKMSRPIPSGRVFMPGAYALWLVLAFAGLGLAFWLSSYLGWACFVLWTMGGLYNIPPVRLKDLPYLDVLSESLNNPLRLTIGWYSTGLGSAPPVSVLLAYWMFGAFLMAVKRFGEFRSIGDPTRAANYRESFKHYNEKRLLLSIIFYVSLFAMFAAVFMTRYRFELLLSAPLIAYALAYYLNLGFQENSPVQRPEDLYKEKRLVLAVALNVIVISVLFFVDIQFLKDLFYPWHLPPNHPFVPK